MSWQEWGGTRKWQYFRKFVFFGITDSKKIIFCKYAYREYQISALVGDKSRSLISEEDYLVKKLRGEIE